MASSNWPETLWPGFQLKRALVLRVDNFVVGSSLVVNWLGDGTDG